MIFCRTCHVCMSMCINKNNNKHKFGQKHQENSLMKVIEIVYDMYNECM